MHDMLTCRICGDVYTLPKGEQLRQCPSCGTVNCRPSEGDVSDMLSRATGQRLRCDFVHAENSYQYVLRESPEEHEALWGLVQCRYGVEYVKDPRTGKRMPIVHAVRKRPMLTDPDFREACDLAPEAVRAQYRQEAEYIDGAMIRILDLAEKGEAYDVFLCHKTSRTDGEEGYTEDFKRATDLYIMLRELGYRVFFAPFAGLTPGENYEAGIYHALTTSKVMLVICSNADYINSPWVRTEWQRFLEMSYEDGADKHLIPLLYEGFSPRRLPDDFRQLQAITMGELNAKDSLVAAMEKYAGAAKAEPEVKKPEPAQSKPAQPAPQPVPVQPELEPKSQPKVEKLAPAQPAPTYAPEDDFGVKAVNGGVTITNYYGLCRDGELLIPPMIGGKKVVAIGAKAFSFMEMPTKVVIPDSVTRIGKEAFQFCRNLTSVSIPEGVTTIEGSAFHFCTSLTSVELPVSLTSIGDNAFYNCSGLACVNIPEGVTSIGNLAFGYCSSLTRVDIPKSVKSIGNGAFRGCDNLPFLQKMKLKMMGAM